MHFLCSQNHTVSSVSLSLNGFVLLSFLPFFSSGPQCHRQGWWLPVPQAFSAQEDHGGNSLLIIPVQCSWTGCTHYFIDCPRECLRSTTCFFAHLAWAPQLLVIKQWQARVVPSAAAPASVRSGRWPTPHEKATLLFAVRCQPHCTSHPSCSPRRLRLSDVCTKYCLFCSVGNYLRWTWEARTADVPKWDPNGNLKGVPC